MTTSSRAWLIVALLVPVALLNYLDRPGGELGEDPRAFQVDLRHPESDWRVSRGPLQPSPCHRGQSVRVVADHLAHGACHHV